MVPIGIVPFLYYNNSFAVVMWKSELAMSSPLKNNKYWDFWPFIEMACNCRTRDEVLPTVVVYL